MYNIYNCFVFDHICILFELYLHECLISTLHLLKFLTNWQAILSKHYCWQLVAVRVVTILASRGTLMGINHKVFQQNGKGIYGHSDRKLDIL